MLSKEPIYFTEGCDGESKQSIAGETVSTQGTGHALATSHTTY
jgi:hypothetical protein